MIPPQRYSISSTSPNIYPSFIKKNLHSIGTQPQGQQHPVSRNLPLHLLRRSPRISIDRNWKNTFFNKILIQQAPLWSVGLLFLSITEETASIIWCCRWNAVFLHTVNRTDCGEEDTDLHTQRPEFTLLHFENKSKRNKYSEIFIKKNYFENFLQIYFFYSYFYLIFAAQYS